MLFVRFLATALLALHPFVALSQVWPTRPVTIVSPYPPGGTNDVVARMLAERLGAAFNVAFIVENRPGAAGIVGSTTVSKAPADGQMLLTANIGSHVIQPLVTAAARYQTLVDFTPIARLADGPVFVGVNADLPAKSMADLIALAKRDPGRLNFGSAGSGSFGNFCGEYLKLISGIDVVHVPYKGSAAALTDLIAGRVQFMIDPLVTSQVKGGKVRVIGVTGMNRYPGYPDVPTMRESGLAEFDLSGWFGVFGPPGLPNEIVAKIATTAAEAFKSPAVYERFVTAGILPAVSSPAEFVAIIRRDQERFADIKRRANIQVVE